MFSYQFTSNFQDVSGDIKSSVSYSNGAVTISENYTDTNAATIIATINSRLSQLQAAETFVTNFQPTNPASSTPISQ